jgi:hypothetical protein
MMRLVLLSLLGFAYLGASTPTPIAMATDLNLSSSQIKKLERIDATVAQVNRHSYAKRIEVLTPEQRKVFFARQKTLNNTN